MNPIPLSEQQPFTYIVNAAIPANAGAQTMLILGNDSDFDFFTMSASTSADTNAAVIPNNFSLLMKDTTTGRDFSTGPVNRFNLAGVLPTNFMGGPRCIRIGRKEQIEFNFVNLTGADITVQIALIGYKVFQRGM